MKRHPTRFFVPCVIFVAVISLARVESKAVEAMVNRENLDLLLETKIRQWSSQVVDVVNGALGPEKNILFDYLPPSFDAPSSLFAGSSSLLTSKRIGPRLLYSFLVKVVSDDCLDLSTPLNQELCLSEFPKYSSTSPMLCRAKLSVEPPRPWRRRRSPTLYLDSLTAKPVALHVQCRIEDKWKTMTPAL